MSADPIRDLRSGASVIEEIISAARNLNDQRVWVEVGLVICRLHKAGRFDSHPVLAERLDKVQMLNSLVHEKEGDPGIADAMWDEAAEYFGDLPDESAQAEGQYPELRWIPSWPSVVAGLRAIADVCGEVAPVFEDPIPSATSRSGSVRLFGRGKPPVVNGREKPPLSDARYDVLLVLVNASPDGLTKDDLISKSRHSDALGILKRLSEKDQDWKSVIHLAGTTGGGYRIP